MTTNMESGQGGIVLFALALLVGGLSMTELDLALGVFLKFVSIISFIVVLVINYKKFIKRLKEIFGKAKKASE